MSAAGPSPVGFSLTNTAGEPTLSIGDGLAVNVLSFVVTNRTVGALALCAGAPVPDGQSEPDGPTTLYVYFGNLLTSPQVKGLSITAPGWVATFVEGAWALTPAAAGSLAANASVAFTIGHVDVDGPPQDGHFIVDYSRLGNVPNGFVHLPLSRVSAVSGGDPVLDLQIGFGTGRSTVVTTVDANHPYVNSLSLQLSTDVAGVAPSWDPARPPLFHLSFLYEESTPGGALTTRDLAHDIKPSPAPQTAAAWGVDPEPAGEDPVWTLRPETGPILGPGSVVEFVVDGIVSPLRPGPTQLSVGWVDVPGFAPGVATAVIQKLAPLSVAALSFAPTWIPKGQSVAPMLYWSVAGDPTTLELREPCDVVLDEAVATSMLSPVAVSASTDFTMRASRFCDGMVVTRSTTFPVVEFATTSTARIAPTGDETRTTAMCLSHDSRMLYVAGSDDSSETTTSCTVTLFDRATLAPVGRIDDLWPAPSDFFGGLRLSIAPPSADGVDRLVLARGGQLAVWDVAEDRSAVRRAFHGLPQGEWLAGVRPSGTVIGVIPAPGAMGIAGATFFIEFTVVEFDPLGILPSHPLGPPIGTGGIFSDLTLSGDGEHIVYLGWLGVVPDPPDDGATPGTVVIRKSRLADGALIDEVHFGTWPRNSFLGSSFVTRFTEMPGRGVLMYIPDDVSANDPPPPPNLLPDLPRGLTLMPLDGSARATALDPTDSIRLYVSDVIDVLPPQYSPVAAGGTPSDLVLATETGIWIAPSDHPTLGVVVPIGPPQAPVLFSADGSVITAIVQDSDQSHAFRIVEITRSVVPKPDVSVGPAPIMSPTSSQESTP